MGVEGDPQGVVQQLQCQGQGLLSRKARASGQGPGLRHDDDYCCRHQTEEAGS